jgi:hypothetical protein
VFLLCDSVKNPNQKNAKEKTFEEKKKRKEGA